jgi:hypothetical protein
MDVTLGQWLPVIVMMLAILFGLLYNNKRLDDFKDLLKSEVARSENNLLRVIGSSENNLRLELARSESNVLQAIEALRAEVIKIEARVANLERPAITRP